MIDYEAYDRLFCDYPDVVSVKEVSRMIGLGLTNTYKLFSDGKLHSLSGTKKKIRAAKAEVIHYVLQCAQYEGKTHAL